MLATRSPGPVLLLICGGGRGSSVRHVFRLSVAGVLVCAGAQPYLGARIVSGDEMIDGVLSPRGFAAARSMEAGQHGGVGGGSIAGAGRKGIGVMMGERAAITSGGGVDELRCRRGRLGRVRRRRVRAGCGGRAGRVCARPRGRRGCGRSARRRRGSRRGRVRSGGRRTGRPRTSAQRSSDGP